MTSPFHFPSLVWGKDIAIYLFLLGISAGMTMMVILLENAGLIKGKMAQSSFVKVTAWLAPLTVMVGLTLLIFHLARPWTFWYLMFNYSHTSIMSMGVVLFQVYFAFLLLWLAVIFQNPLLALIKHRFAFLYGLSTAVLNLASKMQGFLRGVLLVVSIALGAYTGFLLSALISYPMLNNPVLPILFLASGMSSGIATLVAASIFFGKEDPHSPAILWFHRVECYVLIIELFLLFAFFFGLYLGGGQKTVAFYNAVGQGFWAYVFWIGVVLLGIVMPLAMNTLASDNLKHKKGFIYLMAGLTLLGVLALRFFILYAGQMTLT